MSEFDISSFVMWSIITGIFGTSLTAMAMLSLAGIVLSIDAFGPIGIGFGVSTPEDVRKYIMAGADAVIVGSAYLIFLSIPIIPKAKPQERRSS